MNIISGYKLSYIQNDSIYYTKRFWKKYHRSIHYKLVIIAED